MPIKVKGVSEYVPVAVRETESRKCAIAFHEKKKLFVISLNGELIALPIRHSDMQIIMDALGEVISMHGRFIFHPELEFNGDKKVGT